MTFDSKWQDFYVNGDQSLGRHPNIERLLKMFVGEMGSTLELGCGIGPNIPYCENRDTDYHGIDGSESAIRKLHRNFPHMVNRTVSGDFTTHMPSIEGGYDVIFERASLPHNDLESIRRCVLLIYGALKPGGLFVSSDWFSTGHSEYPRGVKLEDGTCADYPDGQFMGAGKVRFSDEAELIDIFSAFEGIHMEERCLRRVGANKLVPNTARLRWVSPEFDEMDYKSVVWDFVVRKPH